MPSLAHLRQHHKPGLASPKHNLFKSFLAAWYLTLGCACHLYEKGDVYEVEGEKWSGSLNASSSSSHADHILLLGRTCVDRFVHLMIDEAEVRLAPIPHPLLYPEPATATRLTASTSQGATPPVLVDNGISFVYVKYGNLYLMACTKRNSNATTLFVFLYHIIAVLKDYFRELEEESIRDNFVVTYELLDEMMDWGYPQITDQKILSEYIMQESHKMAGFAKPPPAVTGVVSWRSEGIKHRKNEIFLDVRCPHDSAFDGPGQDVPAYRVQQYQFANHQY